MTDKTMTSHHITHWTEAEPVRLATHRAGRAYVAGPMTGLPEFNFPAFNAAAARLRAQGVTVLNPAEHGIVDGAGWGDYLRHDLAGLVSCERIHLLPGWSKSKGANLEVLVSLVLGHTITLESGAEAVDTSAVLLFLAKALEAQGAAGMASPWVVAMAAVHHAVEACKGASGQRRAIDMFVNKASLAHEVVDAVMAAKPQGGGL
jgi:Domain of unknown function (DUF4406)